MRNSRIGGSGRRRFCLRTRANGEIEVNHNRIDFGNCNFSDC